MKLKTAIALSFVCASLYLFFCWMSGYNFDSRGPAQGFAALCGIFVSTIPMVAYFIGKDTRRS